MNTENSKTNDPNKVIYQFTDRLNLKNPNKNMALANFSIYYTGKNIKSKYNNRNLKFLLQLGMMDYIPLVSDIQDYFECISKNQTIADNLPVEIYVNKIKNRIVSKIKNKLYSVKHRCIFIPLNRYEHPKSEPKFLKTQPLFC